MDIRKEMKALLDGGLQFSIELDGRDVVVRFGDYLRQQTTRVIFSSFEDAVRWLRRQRDAVTA
jgi:hypothetical protein